VIIILAAAGIIFPTSIFASTLNEQENNNHLTISSREETPYFSIEIPDDWTYETSSNSYATELIGFGVINTINLTSMKIYAKDGIFQQDAYYSVKNAPLEKYVDYKLDQMNRDLWNVTDMENIKWIRF